MMTDEKWMNVLITFPPVLARDLLEEALVMEVEVEGYLVRGIYIDEGVSIEIMYEHCLNMMHPSIRARLVETQTTVSRFSGEQVKPLGKIELDVCFRGSGLCQRAIMKFIVISAPSPYNIILGRSGLRQLRAIPSTIHGMMKKQEIEIPKEAALQEKVGLTKAVLINPAYPEQLVMIGKDLSPEGSTQLKNLLKKNKVIFAWEPSDMTGVPKRIIKHSLNANPSVKPISQKRKVFAYEKIQDYCPLPEIDRKIDSVMGFPLKCFLDAYKGNHQVTMEEEDEEKTAFYTDQGTYRYTKMPFGLKNAGSTYQRLVDEALQSQIG
ncbi:hypothetical protein Tco_1415384 [Tanacetum coccineum]